MSCLSSVLDRRPHEGRACLRSIFQLEPWSPGWLTVWLSPPAAMGVTGVSEKTKLCWSVSPWLLLTLFAVLSSLLDPLGLLQPALRHCWIPRVNASVWLGITVTNSTHYCLDIQVNFVYPFLVFFSDPTLGSFTHSWITCLEQAWRTEILCPATEPTAVAISETSELQLRSTVFPPEQHGHHIYSSLTLPTGPGIVQPWLPVP